MNKPITIKRQIENILFSMELNDKLNLNKLITDIWGYHDFYTRRSFDVHLCNAKKFLFEIYPDKGFKTIKNSLVRTK